jgi:hypothetical protein
MSPLCDPALKGRVVPVGAKICDLALARMRHLDTAEGPSETAGGR